MKRFLSVALIVVLMLTVFAGCTSKDVATDTSGDTAKTDVTEEETTDTGNKTKIKFAVQADSTNALSSIVEAFNAGNDKYEVEAIVLTNDSGSMHDQIVNSLSSKSGEYDILSMDVVWAGEFAAAGYLETLDSLIKDNGWKPSSFNAGSMASGKYKGKNYVLPYFSDLGFLYYRKDIVSTEDAAVLESGAYTWAEFLQMAEKYAGEKETKFGHVYQSKQYEGLTCNLNEFSNNWADIKAGLETMKAFADSEATPGDVLTYTEGETHNAFLNGESVFARNWPYMSGMASSGEYAVKIDQVGFAPLPQGGTVGGWILGMNVNSENKEGAEAFLKFIAGPEGQKINATVGGYLPGFNALLEDADVLNSNPLLTNKAFQKALSTTIARPVAANYSEVSDTIQVKAHEYLSGNGELDSAVELIEEKLQ